MYIHAYTEDRQACARGRLAQGLADAFIMMRLPFDSDGAREVNRCIFETIYYGALSASMEIAKRDGPYETYSVSFRRWRRVALRWRRVALSEAGLHCMHCDSMCAALQGSPVSQGILQYDMWGVTPSSGLWDWAELKREIAAHGVRNSLLVAPMPTASTSQVRGTRTW